MSVINLTKSRSTQQQVMCEIDPNAAGKDLLEALNEVIPTKNEPPDRIEWLWGK